MCHRPVQRKPTIRHTTTNPTSVAYKIGDFGMPFAHATTEYTGTNSPTGTLTHAHTHHICSRSQKNNDCPSFHIRNTFARSQNKTHAGAHLLVSRPPLHALSRFQSHLSSAHPWTSLFSTFWGPPGCARPFEFCAVF
jgi:hypothetical protein